MIMKDGAGHKEKHLTQKIAQVCLSESLWEEGWDTQSHRGVTAILLQNDLGVHLVEC